jgi:hypothetical protein
MFIRRLTDTPTLACTIDRYNEALSELQAYDTDVIERFVPGLSTMLRKAKRLDFDKYGDYMKIIVGTYRRVVLHLPINCYNILDELTTEFPDIVEVTTLWSTRRATLTVSAHDFNRFILSVIQKIDEGYKIQIEMVTTLERRIPGPKPSSPFDQAPGISTTSSELFPVSPFHGTPINPLCPKPTYTFTNEPSKVFPGSPSPFPSAGFPGSPSPFPSAGSPGSVTVTDDSQ